MVWENRKWIHAVSNLEKRLPDPWYSFLLRDWLDPRDIGLPEGVIQSKILQTPSEIEPATCLDKPRHNANVYPPSQIMAGLGNVGFLNMVNGDIGGADWWLKFRPFWPKMCFE